MEVVYSDAAKRKTWTSLPSRLQEFLFKGLDEGSSVDEVAEALFALVEDARGSAKEDATEKAGTVRAEYFIDIWAKSTLLALVEQARNDEQPLLSWQDGKVQRFIEVVAAMSFQPGAEPRIEPSVMLAVLEDLLDMATVEECQKVFPFLESIREHLMKAPSFLGPLRTFNKLLKRLSKTRDNVFSGRILMFMATIWPLSERSAANTPGAFNTSVEVAYSQEADVAKEDPQVDPAFYRTFWSLQEHFRHPAALAIAATLTKFLDALQVVLTYFAENAVGPHSAGQADGEYNTSYLTSPKLFSLQLRDPNFRRHLLLQTLFVLQWLRADRRANKQSKPPFDMVVEVGGDRLADLEGQCKQLLRSLPPHGVHFAALVEHMLEREKNWLRWKFVPVPKPGAAAGGLQMCPLIPKPALQGPAALHPPGKRKAMRRVALGNEVLGRVWHSTRGDPMAALRGKGRNYVPPYLDYMQRLADELDPESGIEEQYKVAKSQVFEWRGLRLTARHNVAAFGEIAKHGGDLVALLPRAMRPAKEAGAEGAEDADNDNDVPQDDEDPGDGGTEETTPVARGESGELDEARRKIDEATPMDVDEKETKGAEESGQKDEEAKQGERATGKEGDLETRLPDAKEKGNEKGAKGTGTEVLAKKEEAERDAGRAARRGSKEETEKGGAEKGADSVKRAADAAGSIEKATGLSEKVRKADDGASKDIRGAVSKTESREESAATGSGGARTVAANDTRREGKSQEEKTAEKGPESGKATKEKVGTVAEGENAVAEASKSTGNVEQAAPKEKAVEGRLKEGTEPLPLVSGEGSSGAAAEVAQVKQNGLEVGPKETAESLSRSKAAATLMANENEKGGPFARAEHAGKLKPESNKAAADAAATTAVDLSGKDRIGDERKESMSEDRNPGGDGLDRTTSRFADPEEGPSKNTPSAKGSPSGEESRPVSGKSEQGKEKLTEEAAVKEAEGGGKGRGRGRGRGKRKPEETMEDLASRRVTRRRR